MKSTQQLMSQLDWIRQAPKDRGEVVMIVCRPDVDQRKILEQGHLSVEVGLEGDNWLQRGYSSGQNGQASPEMQLNIMSFRAISTIAESEDLWPLAGDQLFVDLDLGYDNVPSGTRLQIGQAIVEVTAEPHLGCKKFSDRFGKDAVMFVNSVEGKALNLRGINAKVVAPGAVSTGDWVRKI